MRFFFDKEYFETLNKDDIDFPSKDNVKDITYKQVLNSIYLQCYSFIQSHIDHDLDQINYNIYIPSPRLHSTGTYNRSTNKSDRSHVVL
ncbi:unnamed protein product [Ambrosiozyma monospora]|uniref:Unnamed protein product n=1 Tax=Ambrosiozyma monospora TaxID=43982 RepID=A0A9W7DJC3_AMBMO|nr:unnamed protein product [Ambrosiozyma monospora]